MSAATLLPVDLILKLKEKKWSNKALAQRFNVSVRTICRAMSTHEPDEPTVDFANKLEKLRAEVPNEYCRKELNRTIHYLRTYQASSKSDKCRRITNAIADGARSLSEIAEESNLYKTEAEELIGEMVAEGKVEKRAPGGIANRGRKLKYQYYLIEGV